LDYTSPDVLAASVDTWHTLMVTDPLGARLMAQHISSGRNPYDPVKPNIAKNGFRLSLDAGPGCYELRMLLGDVYERETGDLASLLRTVSDSSEDPDGHLTAMVYDAQSQTIETFRGQGCPPS
jgi:hypothetical protein